MHSKSQKSISLVVAACVVAVFIGFGCIVAYVNYKNNTNKRHQCKVAEILMLRDLVRKVQEGLPDGTLSYDAAGEIHIRDEDVVRAKIIEVVSENRAQWRCSRCGAVVAANLKYQLLGENGTNLLFAIQGQYQTIGITIDSKIIVLQKDELPKYFELER